MLPLQNFSQVNQDLSDLSSDLVNQAAAVNSMNAAWNAFSKNYPTWQAQFQNLQDQESADLQFLVNMTNYLKSLNLFQPMSWGSDGSMGDMFNLLGGMINGVGDAVKDVADDAENAANDAVNDVDNLVNKVANSIGDLFGSIGNIIEDIVIVIVIVGVVGGGGYLMYKCGCCNSCGAKPQSGGTGEGYSGDVRKQLETFRDQINQAIFQVNATCKTNIAAIPPLPEPSKPSGQRPYDAEEVDGLL
jgi:hypothetical protein